LDDDVLQSMSGAQTLEEAVSVLFGHCEDPSTADEEACGDAVLQFFESAPVQLVHYDDIGCRADWDGDYMILSGSDCVTAFHLVDAANEPVDPGSLPPEGFDIGWGQRHHG
jgi:hypothetical protein